MLMRVHVVMAVEMVGKRALRRKLRTIHAVYVLDARGPRWSAYGAFEHG